MYVCSRYVCTNWISKRKILLRYGVLCTGFGGGRLATAWDQLTASIKPPSLHESRTKNGSNQEPFRNACWDGFKWDSTGTVGSIISHLFTKHQSITQILVTGHFSNSPQASIGFQARMALTDEMKLLPKSRTIYYLASICRNWPTLIRRIEEYSQRERRDTPDIEVSNPSYKTDANFQQLPSWLCT